MLTYKQIAIGEIEDGKVEEDFANKSGKVVVDATFDDDEIDDLPFLNKKLKNKHQLTLVFIFFIYICKKNNMSVLILTLTEDHLKLLKTLDEINAKRNFISGTEDETEDSTFP
jgi:hypothetical protein